MLLVDDIDLEQYKIRIQRLKGSLAGIHLLQLDELKVIKALLKQRQT
jgi:hypothetical protein